jgi:hypothetical protein
MKKILISCAFIIISCKNNKAPDPCACAFNIDLLVKDKDTSLDKYRKFMDKKTITNCANYAQKELKLDREINLGEIYTFYNQKCPKYELNLE